MTGQEWVFNFFATIEHVAISIEIRKLPRKILNATAFIIELTIEKNIVKSVTELFAILVGKFFAQHFRCSQMVYFGN